MGRSGATGGGGRAGRGGGGVKSGNRNLASERPGGNPSKSRGPLADRARSYRATTPPARDVVKVSNERQFQESRAQLATKAKAPLVAPAVVPITTGNERPLQANIQRNPSVDLTNKQVLQVKPKESSKTPDAQNLERFDGMTQDPKSGRYYAYVRATNERKWLSSKEVDFLKATKFG